MTEEDKGERKRLGEYLLEAGLLNENQLKEALRRQRQRERLERLLADLAEEYGPIPVEARRWAASLDWPEERDGEERDG